VRRLLLKSLIEQTTNARNIQLNKGEFEEITKWLQKHQLTNTLAVLTAETRLAVPQINEDINPSNIASSSTRNSFDNVTNIEKPSDLFVDKSDRRYKEYKRTLDERLDRAMQEVQQQFVQFASMKDEEVIYSCCVYNAHSNQMNNRLQQELEAMRLRERHAIEQLLIDQQVC
jgi:hypothetical protein